MDICSSEEVRDPNLALDETLGQSKAKRLGSMASLNRADSFRNSSGSGLGESMGHSLHINPKRTRTPRFASMPYQSNQFDSEDSITTSLVDSGNTTDENFDAESAPLLGNSRTFSTSLTSTYTGSSAELTASLREKIHSAVDSCHGLSKWTILKYLKILSLFVITILCCAVIVSNPEEHEVDKITVLHKDQEVQLFKDIGTVDMPNVRLKVMGPFYDPDLNITGNNTEIFLRGQSESKINLTINNTALETGANILVTSDLFCHGNDSCVLSVRSDLQIAIGWVTQELSWQLENEVIYAFLVLSFVYVLIIFELVHRTLAAMLGALAALAVLSALNERPSLEVIISWIDMETLSLLFGMMILVAILSETGFFDYSALKAYKIAKGKIWPLVTLLCVFSAIVSSFLDNVTTILLLTPVTIRLCEVLNLDPRRILIAEVLFSNIGGTATAIGDPPNVIIVGALSSKGISFSVFTMHMFPGIVFVSLAGYGLLRLYYRQIDRLKNKDPQDIAEMKHEIAMWRKAAMRLQVITREETVMRALFLQKALQIEHTMNKIIFKGRKCLEDDKKETLRKLESQYVIKDYTMLLKSSIVLLAVIILLFIYSFVSALHLDIGWIAVLGALWLLVLADVSDMDRILHKVEWSTLLFFAALFILMEALSELGMITTIGDVIAEIIKSVGPEHRLLLAIVVITWISAIASSFIDNIPYTTAMVPVLQHLSEDKDLQLPLIPLVTSLAFGACLGGNGTLIGASCNVVCAGIAEQHGYGFTFWEFFKIGFPMMLVTTLAATCYILLCHSVIHWNNV
ncbi:P protein-like isoform X1 [Biomphalaria glabrata]|uniref:P protein-like isoform X1 n=2 Tax=Biomphalaria glabrata TaxID=6526 RepID=A0A9W3B3W4_BIOGL|nr:P protein-like isoform X1 [Biomphalaria glabrata]KAI8757084.1 P protein-like [Biomphalaria glabrata]